LFRVTITNARKLFVVVATGRPAKLVDKNNVDWIPTLFMNGLDNDQIPKKRDSKRESFNFAYISTKYGFPVSS
jgi:hypothetical protein